MRFHHIMSKLLNQPLFCRPQEACLIYNALAGRFGTPKMEELSPAAYLKALRENAVKASRFEGERVKSEESNGRFPQVEPYLRTASGLAIITADGEFVNRGQWVGADSGVVSYEGLKFQLGRAAKDAKSQAVILDTNTPGGEAVGMPELADFVRKVASVKPVYGIANGMAASAGYGYLSGATRIFNTPSGILGSIGCILIHFDESKALEDQGVVPTIFQAGSKKSVGTSLVPLSESDQTELQGTVLSFYEQFLGTVAEGRGRRLSAKAARATEAGIFIGKDAVEAGLADDVGSFEDIVTELSAKLSRRNKAGSSAGTRSQTMDFGQTVEGPSAGDLEKAKAEGMTAGAQAYQQRLAAILADPRCKDKASIALDIANEHYTMSVDGVCKLVDRIPAPAAAAPTPPAPPQGAQSEAERIAATDAVRKLLAGASAETGAPEVRGGARDLKHPEHKDVAAQEAAAYDAEWDAHAERINKTRAKARRAA